MGKGIRAGSIVATLAVSCVGWTLVHAQPAPPTATPAITVIHAGTLLARPPEPPQTARTIIVRGDRVLRIAEGFVDPAAIPEAERAAVTVVDLKDRFVLPGLLDGHVHLGFQSGGSPLIGYTQSDSEMALTSMIFARRTLGAGFTTVRDLASGAETMFAVKNAINAGRYLGPRILVSGLPITATGGHGDFPGSREDLWRNPEERASGVCFDEGSCRNAVRTQIKKGADVIKLMATGGYSSGTGMAQQLTLEEMKAAVDAAHMRGLKVTTHAYAPTGIRDAVRAGVDSVEHGIGLDEETARAMAARGVFLVPTLIVFEPVTAAAAPTNRPAPSGSLALSLQAFRRARAAGVRIAFGTDTGVGNPHGSNGWEFARLVAAGMTPMEAIASATTVGAEMLGLEKDAGAIAPGFLADMIALTADPLGDVAALRSPDFVMKGGRIAKRNGQMVPAEDWAAGSKHP
jgi:imidazolonepropionase-like amidohydrolase